MNPFQSKGNGALQIFMSPASANKLSYNYSSVEAVEAFKLYASKLLIDIFNYETIDEPLRGIYLVPHEVGYEMLISYCNRIGKPEMIRNCVIEYIHYSQFQAFVTKHDEYYFIGISAAAPALLQVLFHNLFSFTNPFASQYQNETEEARDDKVTYVFPDRLMSRFFQHEALKAEITGLIKDTVPKERWQRIMASKMAELAICFCCAHEIGHLVSGHTDIVERRAFHSIYEGGTENAEQPSRDIGRWLSQSFEIQADRIGIALLYSYVIGTEKHRKKFMHYLRCKNDPASLYGRLLYAVYMVFLLLGQQHYMIDVRGSHPAPITRISFIMAFLGTVMVNQDGYDPADAGNLVEYFADIAEAAWDRIGFPNGRNLETIDDLPAVVQDLQRAMAITSHYFKPKEWIVRFRRS